jgi:peptide/nickel transport system permease protein
MARLIDVIIVVVLALTAVFGMLRLTGDPTNVLAPMDATEQQREELRHQLGFDQPLYVQYFNYMAAAARGDFGHSLRQPVPAMDRVLEKVPASLLLTGVSMVVSLLIAIPVGVIGGARQGRLADRMGMFFAVLGQAIPNFWLAMVLILFFSVQLRWLPTGGMGTWKHMVLPVISLTAYTTSRLARVMRTSMVEVLRSDYIRTARAKGLPERLVVYRHALKNAALPVITIAGLQVGVLFGGSVITESIFSWPGLGRLIVQSIGYRDFPVVLAAVFVLAVMVTLVNALVDMLYAVINPVIHYA